MIEVKTLVMGAFGVNSYIVRNNGHILLIDPTGKAEKIKTHILENEIVDGIVLTHGHFDHIGAVEELARFYNTQVYMNMADEKLVRTLELNSMGKFGDCLKCPISDLLEPIMNIGNFSLEIIYAPGHTSGSTLIAVENNLFTGDVLFKGSIGRTDLYSGNSSEMKRTLSMIRQLNDDYIIYPGHESASTMKEEKRSNPFLS